MYERINLNRKLYHSCIEEAKDRVPGICNSWKVRRVILEMSKSGTGAPIYV
jgi:hypothetical protein